VPVSCSPEKLYVGAQPTIEITHLDIDGDLIDPTSIQVRYRRQGETVTTINHPNAAIVNQSIGVWRFTFPAPLTQAGTYWVTVVASGGGNTATDQIKVVIHGTHS
jgi:hypothetical protein